MAWLALVALLAAPPQSELQEAVKALEQEDYLRAVQLLEKVVESDPEDFRVRFNLAFAYGQLEQDDKAIAQYEKVVEQQPDLTSARLNLGLLLMRNDRAAEAVSHLEAVAAARPEDFPAQLYYARSLLKSGHPSEAVPHYQKALAIEGSSAEAHLELGQALARSEDFEKAAESYRKAAHLEPQLSEMLLELAELLEEKKHTEEALSLYQEYLASHAGAVAVQERVGLLLLELERYPEAVAALEDAVQRNATAANRAALAEAYSRSDQPGKALPVWREAVAAAPDNAELRLRYANALLYSQSFAEAARNYLEVVKRNPDSLDGWNGLAFALYKVENHEGALKALSEAARREPEKPANVYLRAIIQDKMQMYAEAKTDYERFLAMGSGLEDEEWKSRERLKVINKVLEKRR